MIVFHSQSFCCRCHCCCWSGMMPWHHHVMILFDWHRDGYTDVSIARPFPYCKYIIQSDRECPTWSWWAKLSIETLVLPQLTDTLLLLVKRKYLLGLLLLGGMTRLKSFKFVVLQLWSNSWGHNSPDRYPTCQLFPKWNLHWWKLLQRKAEDF